MSVSYGMITITDTTDLGQLSVYLTGSTVRQQIYDSNTNPVAYYPDWVNSPLIITPHVYFNGQSQNLNSNKIEVSWSKVEGGVTYPNGTVTVFPTSPTTTACPESVTDQTSGYKKLQRPANLSINSTGVTYTATITYYPIDNDRTITLQAIATLDLTISNNGADGSQGAPAKALQLIGTGNYFTYRYDGVSLFGTPTITLTAQSQNIDGIHWYCDNKAIKVINGEKVTDETIPGYSSAPFYIETSLTIAGDDSTNDTWIQDLSPSFNNNKSAQFKIVETLNGTEVNSGFLDYMSIYGLTEAAPGTDTYSASLSNDEETIVDYEGTPILDNANTQLFISQGGVDDLENWHITISDTINNSTNFNYTLTNSKDSIGSTTNLTKYGPDKVKVDVMNTSVLNAAKIIFTAVHGVYDNNGNFSADGEVSNIIKEFSLTKSSALVSHSLRLDAVNANKAATTSTYTPAIINVDAITRRGGSTSPYRDAGVIHAKIYYTDGTSKSGYESNTNNSVLQLTLSTLAGQKVISYIDTFLGGTSANNYNDAEDKQKITISTDGTNGSDGDSPWNFILGQQFDAISTDFSNKTTKAFDIIIPIQAVEGTERRTIYKYGGSTYPVVSAGNLTYTTSGGTTGTISPKYLLNTTDKTNDTNHPVEVNNIKYEIPTDTNIGATGTITLTLTYAANQSISQVYSYKAQPEVLKPIRVLLLPSRDGNEGITTFENQSGIITVTPNVLSGTDLIASNYWGNPIWEVFIDNQWKTIVQAAIEGVTVSNNILSVNGSAVEGYLGFRFSVDITQGGITNTYTEYINLDDKDDPLQVELHSTVGEQIINSQGIGVIYARVIRRGDQEDYDTVVPDNLLGIGTTAPTGSINTGDFAGKTGYCMIVTSGNPAKPTGEIRYYWRTATNASWQGYRGQNSSNAYKYTYTWTFRDNNNAPYVYQNSSTPAAINYLLQQNSQTQKPVHNQQFVYIDSSVISNKITAVVKVEL